MSEPGIFDEYLRPVTPKAKSATPRAVMLDVHLPDGSRSALPYSLLTNVVLEGGEVKAEFVPGTVVVEGIDLETVYKALTQHRLRYIALTDDGRAFGTSMARVGPSEDPVITGLRMILREDA